MCSGEFVVITFDTETFPGKSSRGNSFRSALQIFIFLVDEQDNSCSKTVASKYDL